MSKKIKPLKAAGSNYNRNEKFGLNNVPKHFESVTDEEIGRIKKAVMDEIEKTSQFKPGALKDTLESIDGHFESAYSTLEGDYGARLANLDEIYTRGLTSLRRACDAFALQVVEYNNSFEEYSEANKKIAGEELPKNLMITNDGISAAKQLIERLDERSK